MAYWLLKSEPDEYGIQDLAAEPSGKGRWDGVRNFQACNLIRDQIKLGDKGFFYHSSCKQVGIAGTLEVVSEAYPDPAQFDPESPYFDAKATQEAPRWFCVDVAVLEQFDQVIPLKVIKSEPALADMALLKQPRLSVQPVTAAQWLKVNEMR